MIIVTGLGRCGTSFLTYFLQQIGINVGTHGTLDPYIRAGMEWNKMYSIIELMYREFLTYGKINADTYKDTVAEINTEVVKDPRLTWEPEILEAWYKLKDFKLLILHREPIEDIIKSRQSLPISYRDPKRANDPKLFRNDIWKFMAKVGELGIDFRVLMFPDFLFNYKEVYDAVTSLGITFDFEEGNKKWEEIIDTDSVTSLKHKPKGNPSYVELFEKVASWEPCSIPFSSFFVWDRWAILGVLGDYALFFVKGDIVEIGIGESSIFFTRLAKKYNRKAYHCSDQANVVELCKNIEGYFGENAIVHSGSSNDFFETIDIRTIAVALIDVTVHTYEQTKKDFENIFSKLSENGIIFLHDTYPINEDFLIDNKCGDLYKLRQELERRDDVDCFTFVHSAWDVGLTMIRKKPKNLKSYQE